MRSLLTGLKARAFVCGGAVAAGASAFASLCAVPAGGFCTGCGACLVPAASLALWARLKGRTRTFRGG
ncbi:MAG TPA: hypothetical protein ENJ37_09275 [Deltaproteobacteria bacterium]|nr:hypothetical protein [Deltaproteobacteria bacterium]